MKKNVVEVSGALALLELLGYRTVELKGHPYIAIDDAAPVDNAMLEKTIKMLLQYQERQVEEDNSQQLNEPPHAIRLSTARALLHAHALLPTLSVLV